MIDWFDALAVGIVFLAVALILSAWIGHSDRRDAVRRCTGCGELRAPNQPGNLCAACVEDLMVMACDDEELVSLESERAEWRARIAR